MQGLNNYPYYNPQPQNPKPEIRSASVPVRGQ